MNFAKEFLFICNLWTKLYRKRKQIVFFRMRGNSFETKTDHLSAFLNLALRILIRCNIRPKTDFFLVILEGANLF